MSKRRDAEKPILEGLRFECKKGCIKCCEIPGAVFVHESEIPAMAKFFNLTPEEFISAHLNRHLGGVYQFNFDDDEPCRFLQPSGCSIYEVRPAQCSSFPFWPENISNPDEWEKLRAMCPGIGRGRVFSIDEITEIMTTVCYGPFIY